MSWLGWALYMLMVVAPPLLLLLYAVGIQYQSGDWMRYWMAPWVLVAFLLDVLLNYTALVIYTANTPNGREFTFSQRMPRLIAQGGRVGRICYLLALALNELAPKPHIKLQGDL